MYRLIVVSDSHEMIDFLKSFDLWLNCGFKNPYFLKEDSNLKESIKQYKIDAIAVDDSFDCKNKLYEDLNVEFNNIPIFKLYKDYGMLYNSLKTLKKSLDKINSDYTNDVISYDDSFINVQRRWISKYLRGGYSDITELIEKNLIYRTNIDLNAPCALAEIDIIQKDDFIARDWKYGPDWLANALRNFIELNDNSYNVRMAITTDGCCRILLSNAYNFQNDVSMLLDEFTTYLNNILLSINENIKIDSNISSIKCFKNHFDLSEYLLDREK